MESDETPDGVILVRISLFLLSSATLLFEINLTRLFSVAQFYHFAFMIVSLALLGFGASGTALSIYPKLISLPSLFILVWSGIGTAVSMLASYLLINWLPFDSFSIAWDFRQVFILVLHYTALATPFFFLWSCCWCPAIREAFTGRNHLCRKPDWLCSRLHFCPASPHVSGRGRGHFIQQCNRFSLRIDSISWSF